MMRIQYNIPDKATGASIFHIMLTDVPHEFSAAKWCGGGTRAKDPVGDEFPVETSETRAIRRAMRLVATTNPSLGALIEPNDDDSIDSMIGETLREGLLRAKQDQIASAAQMRGVPLMLNSGDPYNLERKRKGAEPIPVVEPAVTTMPIRSSELPPTDVDVTTGGAGATAVDELEPQNDLDLLTPEERADYEQRRRS
jgi:hypothetical protein